MQQADNLDQPQPQPQGGDEDGEDEGDGEGDGDGDGDQDGESPPDSEGGGQGQPQAGNAQAESMRQQAEQLRQKAEQIRPQAQAKAQAAAAKISDRLDKPMGKAALANAAKEGQQEAEEVTAFMESWGLDGGDMNAEDAQDLIDFKQSADVLSKMIGRMKGIAKRQIERVKQETIGPVSEPAYTKNVLHLFPTELMKLMPQSPLVVRATAVDKLVNGAGLLGWRSKITGEREGHFLIVVDRSGSMTLGGNPDRITTAKSIAIGMAMAAKEDANRRWELYYFDGKPPPYHPTATSQSGWKDGAGWMVKLKPANWDADAAGLVTGGAVAAAFEAKMAADGFAGCS